MKGKPHPPLCECNRKACFDARMKAWSEARDKFLTQVAAMAHDKWYEGQDEPWTVYQGDWRICVHPIRTEPRAMVMMFDGQHYACSLMLDQPTGAYSCVYIDPGYKIL